jgi:hypothetical protein
MRAEPAGALKGGNVTNQGSWAHTPRAHATARTPHLLPQAPSDDCAACGSHQHQHRHPRHHVSGGRSAQAGATNDTTRRGGCGKHASPQPTTASTNPFRQPTHAPQVWHMAYAMTFKGVKALHTPFPLPPPPSPRVPHAHASHGTRPLHGRCRLRPRHCHHRHCHHHRHPPRH